MALFSKVYFEHGNVIEISPYRKYCTASFQGFHVMYDIAFLIIRTPNLNKVLELGCTNGRFVKALGKLGVNAYGIDISSHALKMADRDVKRYLLNVDLDTERERIFFKSGVFDAV